MQNRDNVVTCHLIKIDPDLRQILYQTILASVAYPLRTVEDRNRIRLNKSLFFAARILYEQWKVVVSVGCDFTEPSLVHFSILCLLTIAEPRTHDPFPPSSTCLARPRCHVLSGMSCVCGRTTGRTF